MSNKIAALNMLQDIIKRLADNSFKVKTLELILI